MTEKITIRSDRDTDYKFMYKGEEVVLGAGKIIGIADGLEHVVLPTCAMKVKLFFEYLLLLKMM